MTPKQIQLVQVSWRKIFPRAVTVGEVFYNRLFEVNPSLKPLFKTPMHQQIKKLFATLDAIVKALDDLDTLIPLAQELAITHIEYGVKEEDYDTVGEALLWAMEQSLGQEFTREMQYAWALAYNTLATAMKEAAADAMDNDTNQ